jgi:hypothetical protein
MAKYKQRTKVDNNIIQVIFVSKTNHVIMKLNDIFINKHSLISTGRKVGGRVVKRGSLYRTVFKLK